MQPKSLGNHGYKSQSGSDFKTLSLQSEENRKASSLFVDVLGESVNGLLGVLMVAVYNCSGSGAEGVPHGLFLRLVRLHVGFHLLHETVILPVERRWEKLSYGTDSHAEQSYSTDGH